jgi:hypothetical protein
MKNEKNQNQESTEVASVTMDVQVTPSEAQELNALIESASEANLAKMKPVVSLTVEYYEFLAIGDKLSCVFGGYTTATYKDAITGGMVEKKAVRLVSNGKIYLNSGYMLVDALQKSNITSGTPILITYVGKVGNGKKYSVDLLG